MNHTQKKETAMSDFSESAITLGRVEAEFNYAMELLGNAGLRERYATLGNICSREGVSSKGFEYLEDRLLITTCSECGSSVPVGGK